MAKAEQQTSKPSFQVRLGSYGINHARTLISSLGRLYQHKLASLMTIAVIAIALALPTGFYIILKNASQLSGNWDSPAKISAYLNDSITEKGMQQIANKLKKDSRIENVETINADQALAEFKLLSGFGAALDALNENPLPSVIVVTPIVDPTKPEAVEELRTELSEIAGIEQAKLDMQWVQRLFAIMRIVERALMVIAILLALAVILTIGNTIRLDIQSRRTEIVVQKLIGATNAFIRRPFLYTGLWYGLLGGIAAWLLISISLQLLQGPVQQLAGLYSSQFTLRSLSLSNALLFITLAIALGLLGSWLAVSKHLKEIEPK